MFLLDKINRDSDHFSTYFFGLPRGKALSLPSDSFSSFVLKVLLHNSLPYIKKNGRCPYFTAPLLQATIESHLLI